MSSAKSALKAAKAAIDARKFQDAAVEANKVLSVDPTSYHANVFLGLALDKQNQNEASEKAYRGAINNKKQDVLAWQGLVALYEKQAGEKLDDYHDAALHLAEIHMNDDDRNKCQTVIDRYTGDAKKYGSRNQIKRSLEILLPGSPVFDFLEGRILQPGYTYIKLADLIEAEEKEKINTEIGQRRTRLGARIDQVTAEVKREILQDSPLEDLYKNIINWTHDDDVRRKYEERLLQHAGDTLAALPMSKKTPKREVVIKLAEGLVILKHPFLLAWRIVLEWKDVKDIKDLDAGLLREFIDLFPQEGLSKVLRGYLASEVTPFPTAATEIDKDVEEGDENSVETAEQPLILMTEGIEDASHSILAHRLMGQYYLFLDEFESAVSTARAGLKRITAESNLAGLNLVYTQDAMNAILASALIYYQAPRHHGEARLLFEDVLGRQPADTSALIGIGMIYQEEEEYAKAVDSLDEALKRSQDPKIKAEAAWCKALNGDAETALPHLEACLSEMGSQDAKAKSLRSQTLFRVGMCLWSLHPSKAARKDRNGAYSRFLASVQVDMNYAPAYSSLGIYYADYAKDKKRARKCFQKAFELSASEIVAAHRLAMSFASSGEWDLVEVIAQRVVDSGKTRPAPGSKKRAISWPHAALGVVQLSNQDYVKSIVSFQSALRTSPEDYHCWVGLGESYHNSGRYVAATKAFEHAQQLKDASNFDNYWFSIYMLANVKRELGDYDGAITNYQRVLEDRPDEYGVSIALLQTLVERAWRSVELGFFGRAAKSAQEVLCVAQTVARLHDDAFNLWKAVGDACSIFSAIQGYEATLEQDQVRSLLEIGADPSVFAALSELDGITMDSLQYLSNDKDQGPMSTSRSMTAAILAQKRAVFVSGENFHAQAVAWYNLGWTEHRAYMYGDRTESKAPGAHALGHLKAAVQCFKRAIELEASNAEFWNSLGIVTSDFSPKVAQHAFVRSLHLNDKNARIWTNLGTLYFMQNDIQLAQEAFTRAQSTDPDYAKAWLGQGLIAVESGDSIAARLLFAHAYEISDSSSTPIQRHYAIATFDHIVTSPASIYSSDHLQPLHALHQIRSLSPSDFASQQLSSMFAERVANFENAMMTLELICSRLEVEYETSESPVVLTRFSQAKADLARAQLARKDFALASENAETAIDLSADDNEADKSCQKVRLSAHMTAGLAYYYQGFMDQAIDMFKNALSETQGNPDVVCLLAQVLWAKGGDSEREVAHEQLLDCIENHPGHVGVTTLLGCIAILDNDQDTLEVVTADLEGLRSNDSLSTKEQRQMTHLLTMIASLHPPHGDQKTSELSQAHIAIMLAPSRSHGWNQLATLSDENFPAEVAVLTAIRAVPPRGNIDAPDLCRAYVMTGRLEDAQRAIMIAPFAKEGWEAME